MITATPGSNTSPQYGIADLKRQMSGRWPDLLLAHGLTAELTDGRGHPCPRCGGEDRFNVKRDTFQSRGEVFCRHCHERGGDGFDTLVWLAGGDKKDSYQTVAEYLGVSYGRPSPQLQQDVVEVVARAKGIPSRDALAAYGAKPAKGQSPCVVVPVYSCVDGQAIQTSTFSFGVTDKGKHQRGAKNPGVFLPDGRTPQPGETWLVVEGVKDAAALYHLGFNCAGLPTCKLPIGHERFFNGVHVIIVPDLDTAGQDGSVVTGGRLEGIAASVKVARLPGEVTRSSGDDVRDVFRKHGEQTIRDAIASAEAWEPREGEPDSDDGRPEVHLTVSEADVARQVIYHLGQLGRQSPWIKSRHMDQVKIYQANNQLVQVIQTDEVVSGRVELPIGSHRVRDIPDAILRERITQACKLIKTIVNPNGELVDVVTSPPKWLVLAILHRGSWDGMVPVLKGVVDSPTLRPDGTILQSPGYDEDTGLLYRPATTYPWVKDADCTLAQVREDIEHIRRECVSDFPFETDSDFSSWLSYVMTLLVRHSIEGPVPLFPVTANVRGAGKSLLVDVANLIVYGRTAARKTYADDDAEMRKTITSIALEMVPSVLLDNVATTLGGASLDSVLTGQVWTDRLLGTNKTTGEVSITTTWAATGNNMSLGADITRRLQPIRLMSDMEKPELRTGFTHENIQSYVKGIRGDIVARLLRIVRAYILAGKPRMPGGECSYPAWSALVRGALVWAGAADPLLTRNSLDDSDSSVDLLRMIHAAIGEGHKDGHRQGVTASELLSMASKYLGDEPRYPAIADLVQYFGKVNARSLGRHLLHHKNRWLDGQCLTSTKDRSNVMRWTLKGKPGSQPQPQPQPAEVDVDLDGYHSDF